jgi:histidine triad (HIT) family protein
MTPPPAADCVFCGIVAGTVAAHTVDEDDLTVAFLDINPAAEGHTLVVPKRHVDDLLGADEDTAAAVMRTATRVARLLDERLAPDGLTLFQANRSAGWQDVFHLHLHLVPRWAGDRLVRPWTSSPGRARDLAATAARLRG